MKSVVYALALSIALWTPAQAQTGLTGTWQAEGMPSGPWTIDLEVDGATVDGTVSMPGAGPVEIYEGRIDGNTITFKCQSPDGDRTITFTGAVKGDEIAFTREVQVRDGGQRGAAGIFGSTAARVFTVRRVDVAAGSPPIAAAGPQSQLQQVADTAFRPLVPIPAYPEAKGPVVLIDEAHDNFHTATGRYLPFAELLRRDGYVVEASAVRLTARALPATGVLVISNAREALAAGEVTALRDWVASGGSLLLIADHPPFDTAAQELGQAFGIRFSGMVGQGPRESDYRLVFRRSDGTLLDHAITEAIDAVATFTGTSFEVDAAAQPLLLLRPGNLSSRDGNEQPLEGHLQGAVLPFGEGRVAVFGEAAMFSAQITGADRHPMGMNAPIARQNAQFLLNVMHWLTRLM